MFEPIKQPNVLPEILRQIKKNVAEGKLKKGDKLPTEREMARVLGVSRTTLREAIKSLEIIGFVECNQGNGNYLSKNLNHSFSEPLSIMFMLEGGTVSQVHEFRQAIETVAVRHAAMAITPPQIQQLEDICEQMENGKARIPLAEMSELDRNFHRSITEITGNSLLITMMNAAESLIQSQIQNVRNVMTEDEKALCIINEQHRAITTAFRNHDPEGAARTISKHMDFVQEFERSSGSSWTEK